MTVMKFGGAVLREPQGFRHMVQILQDLRPERVVVVISAFATATRDLEFSARLAQKGLAQEADERLRQVVADHRVLVKALLPQATSREGMEALLSEAEADLRSIIGGVAITKQLTAKTLDRVLAYGEFLALHIARHVLQDAGIDVVSVDARSLIVTSNNFGCAVPLTEKTAVRVEHNLLPALGAHSVVLVQGFVGQSEDGFVTTMGKESSNLTATLLGAVLGASEAIIYTDVEGVRSADPHSCEHTLLRPHMSYAEARVAAEHGLKLLYPTMIAPAEQSGLAIRIAAAHAPAGESTLINGNPQAPCQPIVIEHATGSVTDVTTVFINGAEWISHLALVLEEEQLRDAINVRSNHADRTATVSVPSADANRVARALHHHIQQSGKDV